MTNTQFRPMKPFKQFNVETDVVWPMLATPKIDGIRCVKLNGAALTSSLKPIPNDYVRQAIEDQCLNNWDGELTLRDPGATFQDITSAIMSEAGAPDFLFNVFDIVGIGGYAERLALLDAQTIITHPKFVRVLYPKLLRNLDEYNDYANGDGQEDEGILSAYEGICLRHANGLYKYGRSTLREHGLLAVKPFVDADATILDIVEAKHNLNPAYRQENGLLKRSHAAAGLSGKGCLGAFLVQDSEHGSFEVGPGVLTAKERTDLWNNRNAQIGKVITFKYQKHGTDVRPRCPTFLRFRHVAD